MDQSLLDSLAAQMSRESTEQLGMRVRDGIPAILPHEGGGTEMRVPTSRQFLEAWVASHELESRARGLAGEPPPAPVYQMIGVSDLVLDEPPPAGVEYVYIPEQTQRVHVDPEPVVVPEKPAWWAETERHALAEETEVRSVDLPDDITLTELEEKILKGMPRRVEDTWRIPSPQELAEAHAALAVLIQRARQE